MTTEATTPPTEPTAAPATEAATPPTETPAAITFPTTEAFNARVEQAARSMLKKEVGVGDLKTIKERMEQAAALQKAEEERNAAQMSELERERAARASAEAEAARYREEAAANAFEAHIVKVCAERGIKDIDYAKYRVKTAAEALEEGAPPIDERAFLDGLLQDPRHRVALGVDDVSAPAVEPQRTAAVTTPATVVRHGTPNSPPVPAPITPAPQTQDAMSLSPEAWQARKRALGVG